MPLKWKDKAPLLVSTSIPIVSTETVSPPGSGACRRSLARSQEHFGSAEFYWPCPLDEVIQWQLREIKTRKEERTRSTSGKFKATEISSELAGGWCQLFPRSCIKK